MRPGGTGRLGEPHLILYSTYPTSALDTQHNKKLCMKSRTQKRLPSADFCRGQIWEQCRRVAAIMTSVVCLYKWKDAGEGESGSPL